ncbi:unnamed protein product, partial [Owenia fusiformis]
IILLFYIHVQYCIKDKEILYITDTLYTPWSSPARSSVPALFLMVSPLSFIFFSCSSLRAWAAFCMISSFNFFFFSGDKPPKPPLFFGFCNSRKHPLYNDYQNKNSMIWLYIWLQGISTNKSYN